MTKKKILILGAGPAGLTAALKLSQNPDFEVCVFEELDQIGGLSRTLQLKGFSYELGPHRIFTKNQAVKDFLEALLPTQGKPAQDDLLLKRTLHLPKGGPDPEQTDKVMLIRRRFSRIYYKKHFFDYPISLSLKTIMNLGLWETFCCGVSYLKSLVIRLPEDNLENFIINRFGKRLYSTFFEHYTQQVWGTHPQDIPSSWGYQRIKGVSIKKVLANAVSRLLHLKSKSQEVFLIDSYMYPKYACGQLWEEMKTRAEQKNCVFHLNAKVTGLTLDRNRITRVQTTTNGTAQEHTGDLIISSLPIKHLINGLSGAPEKIKQTANQLEYRDYIHVAFVVKKFNLKNNTAWPTLHNIAPDSWIYIQDKNITMGRIQIVNNWSPYVLGNAQDVAICTEYFATEGDALWTLPEAEMIALATRELIKLNACLEQDIVAAHVQKVKKAYPAYFGGYKDFDQIKEYLNGLDNLYCIGRNGQHKYNNMDHSVFCGLQCAQIIENNLDKKSLWELNTEKEYQESAVNKPKR